MSVETIDRKPHHRGVVATLKIALDRARRGDLTDVAIACLYANGDMGTLSNTTERRDSLGKAAAVLLEELKSH